MTTDSGPRDGAVMPRDTGRWMIDPSRGDSLRLGDGEQARTPESDAVQPDGNAAGQGEWTSADISGGSDQGVMPTLTDVRSGAHDEYDRLVFEFDERVPHYSIDYVDRPQYQCGSGKTVWLPGDGWLRIHFTPTRAHDEQGRATVENRSFDPDGENLLEARLICDFEGHVEWLVGMAAPNPYRVLVLSSPPRLVVDVRR